MRKLPAICSRSWRPDRSPQPWPANMGEVAIESTGGDYRKGDYDHKHGKRDYDKYGDYRKGDYDHKYGKHDNDHKYGNYDDLGGKGSTTMTARPARATTTQIRRLPQGRLRTQRRRRLRQALHGKVGIWDNTSAPGEHWFISYIISRRVGFQRGRELRARGA